MTKTTIEELLPKITWILNDYANRLEVEEDELALRVAQAILENSESVSQNQKMLRDMQKLSEDIEYVLDTIAEILDDNGGEDTITAALAEEI